MDAVKKTYLKELVLGLCEDKDKPEDAFETYTFKFVYSQHKGINAAGDSTSTKRPVTTREKNEIYNKTRVFLRQILQCTNLLNTIPDEAYRVVRLGYYEDRTPADYEPPGFVSTNMEFKCHDREDVSKFQTDKVITRHHGVQVEVHSSEKMPCGAPDLNPTDISDFLENTQVLYC